MEETVNKHFLFHSYLMILTSYLVICCFRRLVDFPITFDRRKPLKFPPGRWTPVGPVSAGFLASCLRLAAPVRSSEAHSEARAGTSGRLQRLVLTEAKDNSRSWGTNCRQIEHICRRSGVSFFSAISGTAGSRVLEERTDVAAPGGCDHRRSAAPEGPRCLRAVII